LSDEPGFYSANWLYLGKVYLKLGQRDKAHYWLKKAANYHPENQEDVEVNLSCEDINIFDICDSLKRRQRNYSKKYDTCRLVIDS